MRKISLAAMIVSIPLVIVSCCNTPKPVSSVDLCSKETINRCQNCSPYMVRLKIVTNKLDETKIKEVKYCGDLAANLSIKEAKFFDASFKGCINNNIVLDEKTRDALIKEIEKAQVPEPEYNAWLDCYKKLVGRDPVVVILDQPNDALTYCEYSRRINASNAFDIQNLINDLPINPIPLSTHLEWKNEQQVINLEPKLIVVHASAFYKKTRELQGNDRLLLFLDSLKGAQTKILVYTRGLPDQPTERMKKQWDDLIKKINDPEMKKNTDLFIMPKGHKSCFTDPEIGVPFKNKIKEMLSLK